MHPGLAILLAILVTVSADSFAADILRTDAGATRWNLAPHAGYLKETGAELTVEELMQSP